jgi:hypothetical protein
MRLSVLANGCGANVRSYAKALMLVELTSRTLTAEL